MKELVTIYNDELRCGTYLLAEGFNRKHSEILKLCRKYKNEMMEFENNKGVRNTFIINKIPKKTAGQPIKEYLLNNQQVLFILSLLRASNQKIVDIKVKSIKVSEILTIIKAIQEFDTDDIPVNFVYAMQDQDKNIKIGISNDPERRLKEINAANAQTVDLVLVMEAKKEKYQDEVDAHNLCSKYYIKNEWYEKKALDLLVDNSLNKQKD